MKSRILVLVAGLTGLAAALFQRPAVFPRDEQNLTTCQLSAAPAGSCPELIWDVQAELLAQQQPELQRAYFAMGCFWGSEAMLAGCPGVEFTQVGFSGGTTPDPSYSAIGDHVETVEVSYDPQKVTYSQLLDYFWRHHNAHAKPIFRQYASAVFTLEPAQTQVAKQLRDAKRSAQGEPLLTAVRPLQKFYPAEMSHQKYYLQQDSELLGRLPRQGEQRLNTRLACKLNALLGSGGDQAALQSSLIELGLSNSTLDALFHRAAWYTK